MSVFCPFAAGYFLSFCFRNVNAVISKELVAEFSLTPADLGFLTSMYLLAFAAFQLPLGVLLDRYGPRRVVATLLCVAAGGALVFALARELAVLSLGRALIGLGVSAGLMGAIKSFSLWFSLARLATMNGHTSPSAASGRSPPPRRPKRSPLLSAGAACFSCSRR